MTIEVGRTLSHYQVLGALGVGAMGEVYRAMDTRLGREVAIKVLPEHFVDDPERLKRFEREAKTLASLNHSNVAQIFGVDQVGDTCFLVLELVPGESLEERLKKGRLSIEESLDVGRQIAEGLEAAHEAGVIHRDLKPANVRITPDGKVKVLDFGLAKPARESPDGSSTDSVLSTEAGRLLGTPTYMAPEQVRGRPIDKRVDIWAFGCVLYECLTAKRAFAGETLSDVLASVIEREPDWTKLPAATPVRLREFLRSCLAKDPRLRVRDIGELRVLLGGAFEAIPTVSAPRKRPVVLAALAALFAGSALTAALLRRPAEAPRPGAFRLLNLRGETIFRAAFAPDGRTVVYSAARTGNRPEIFAVRPDYPEPQSMGLSGAQLLGLSSQGELAVLTGVRYIAHRLFVGTLARVPLGGGAPREVLEEVREADWSPDGSELAIIREVGGKDRLEYPMGTVLCESSGYLSDLRISPAGDRIAYFEHPFRWDDRGSLNVVDLEGRVVVLADGNASEEGIAWTPDGREILYSAVENGTDLDVYAMTPGGEKRVAFDTPGGVILHDLSRDGRWLLTRDVLRNRLMARVPGAELERDLSWLDGSAKGILAQDGETIVFTEQSGLMGTNYALCMRKTDGSPVVRLGEGACYDLTRDVKWALAIVHSTSPKLVLYPMGPGEARELACGELERLADAELSRDGSRVVFNAAEPGRGLRYYIMELGGGAPRPVTPEGTRQGRLSPDGRRILAMGPDGAFQLFPVEGGAPVPVPGLVEQDQLIQWTTDGRAVLLYRPDEVPCRVMRLDVETGNRELFRELAPRDLTGIRMIYNPHFTDDGRWYTYYTIGRTSSLFASGMPD